MEELKARGATRWITAYTKNLIIGFAFPVFITIAYQTYKHFSRDSYKCRYYKLMEDPSSWININHVSSEELASSLPISLRMAKKIVSYRERLGGFHSVEQIKEVSGWNIHDLHFALNVLYVDSTYKPHSLKPYYKSLVRHPYITPRMAWILSRLSRANKLHLWEVVLVDSLKACNKALAQKLKPYLQDIILSHRAK